MKRKLIILLMLWICFLLQTTVFNMLDFLAATPNLLLILTVSIGFMQGKQEGLLTGFAAGLMIDLFYGDIFGFYALLYMLAGYFSGRFSQIYFDEDVKIPLMLTALCDLFLNTAIYFLRFLLRGRVHFFSYLSGVIFPEVVCTVLFTIVFYRIFYKVNHSLLEKEKRGRQSLWIKD